MSQEKPSVRRVAFAMLSAFAISAVPASRTPAASPDTPVSSPSVGGEKPGVNPPVPNGSGNPDRLREGTKLAGELGVFQRKGGDRYTFRTNAGKREFACLENLNLERIAAAVADNPDMEWLVSGTVTEYRGTNCLLISQATLKAKSGRATGP